jgi:hypothetical protein
VRTIRIWLLLLLALLIPVRGAVAATMLCLPSGNGTQNEQRAEDHSHHGHMNHDSAVADDSQADTGHQDGGHHPADAGGKCTLCSACCSSASLLNSVTDVGAAQDLSPTTFPDLSAPAPTFLSDGQERPPRSI